jgi:hypothetical protein
MIDLSPRTLRRITTAVLTCLLMVSCTEEVDRSALIDTYADVLIARESSLDTAVVRARVDSVLRAHSYDKARFDTDLRSMGTDARSLTSFYDSVTQRLARKREATSR